MVGSPRKWAFETWLTIATVLLGVAVASYGLTVGNPAVSTYGVGFIVLSVFLWFGRPTAQ